MATKEDILEQIVDEYLVRKGYFVQHNIKFLPRKDHPDFIKNKDSNHSDIDVLAIHPKLSGPEAVMAVSCKNWQSGFNPAPLLIRRRPLLCIVKYADNLQPVRADLSVDDDEGYAFNYEFTRTGNSTYSARPWMSWQYDFYCLDNS